MTICLVRCPSPFLIDERAFPPLGLLAVGAGLKQRGHDVVVYDGPWEDLPMGYSHYGFGPTAPEYPAAREAMEYLHAENPIARVVLGGPHATVNYSQVSRHGWDSIVVGDGEVAAEEALFGKTPRIFAEELPLDGYPFPDRSLLDLRNYHYELQGRPATTLMTGRGCPYHCAYCCKNHGRVRLRSADSVIAEVAMLQGDYGYSALAFPEDIFILNRSRAERVADYLGAQDILWRCLVRADILVRFGAAFARRMADGGCVSVGMGVESGSDTILRNVNKGETVAIIREAIGLLKDAGIAVKGYFIVGLPGESEETLAETEAFLREAKLDDIDVKIFQPYPGSPIVNHPDRYDVIWENGDQRDAFYKGRPGDYRGSVRTSALTNERIVEVWKHLENTYKRWEVAPTHA